MRHVLRVQADLADVPLYNNKKYITYISGSILINEMKALQNSKGKKSTAEFKR